MKIPAIRRGGALAGQRLKIASTSGLPATQSAGFRGHPVQGITVQLQPDLPGAVDPVVVPVHPADLGFQPLITGGQGRERPPSCVVIGGQE
jgi:hypothetical protein